MAANPSIDKKQYAKLLGKVLPVAITNDEEHERMLSEFDRLFNKKELSAEEEEVLKLLTALITTYEEKHLVNSKVTPLESLKFLMEDHGIKAKDLWGVVGSKGSVSDILNGRRLITLAQAKALGKFFNVSPAIFIRLED